MRNRYHSLSLHNSKPLSLVHPNVCAGNAFPTFSVHLIPLSTAQLISPPPWSLPQLLQPTKLYFSELQHSLYNHLLMIFLTDIKPAFTIRIKQLSPCEIIMTITGTLKIFNKCHLLFLLCINTLYPLKSLISVISLSSLPLP